MASRYSDRSSILKSTYGSPRYTHDNTISSCRRSRYDSYSSPTSATSPTRSRMTASVDRDVGSAARKSNRYSYSRPSYSVSTSRTEERSRDSGLGRRAFSMDRDVGSGYEVTYSSTKTTSRPWRDRLKQAQERRYVGETLTTSYKPREAESIDSTYSRLVPSSYRSRRHDYDVYDYRALASNTPVRPRSASLSRFRDRSTPSAETLADDTYGYRALADNAPIRPRSASLSRFCDRSTNYGETLADDTFGYRALADNAPIRPRSASLSRFCDRSTHYAETLADYEDVIKETQRKRAQSLSRFEDSDLERRRTPRRAISQEVVEYTGGTIDHSPRRSVGREVVQYAGDRFAVGVHQPRSREYTHYAIDTADHYEPDEVKVMELPSGRKAVTYSRFSQTGHGNREEANAKINQVAMRTQYLEQTATSLEDFVRRNRRYFPEDTTIYQQIRFFQLNAEQLREIREPPEAEVYGVKVREKLVVPPGTDVAHVLNRYYKNDDVDVEYSRGGVRVTGGDQIESNRYGDIRRQVKAEYESRGRQWDDDSFEVRVPTQHVLRHDDLDYSHLSPTYRPKPSVYRDSGLVYDDIYQGQPRSSITSPTASIISDQESLLSGGSSRKRTYDSVPHFTAKLRNKQCILGQTIKFNCSVSGLPFPDISWFKGNRQIHEGGRFKFSVSLTKRVRSM